jgi:hypothetical protein
MLHPNHLTTIVTLRTEHRHSALFDTHDNFRLNDPSRAGNGATLDRSTDEFMVVQVGRNGPMRTLARPSIITLLTMIGTALLSVVSTVTAAITLTATALIVPGTGTPNANIVAGYLQNAENYYITPFNPACSAATACTLQGIDYPAQFWPIPLAGWGGLTGDKWNVSTGQGIANLNTALQAALPSATAQDPIVIMGYSQGGNIVSRYKRTLANLTDEEKSLLSFVMIGNTNRPNGGLFERLAFLGTVPILDATFGLPAPTNTGIKTTDIAFQYDGVSDFPLYPLNALADLNAIFGFWYVHGTYLTPNAHDTTDLPDGYTEAQLEAALADPANQKNYGDTTYITIPTRTLPLVQPLLDIGNATHTIGIMRPLVDLISPVLRVLIDTGYNRGMNPGVPAPFELLPLLNPITLAVNLVNAVGQGVQAAINDITGRGNPTGTGAGTSTTTSTPDVQAVAATGTKAATDTEASDDTKATPKKRAAKKAVTTTNTTAAQSDSTDSSAATSADDSTSGQPTVIKSTKQDKHHKGAAKDKADATAGTASSTNTNSTSKHTHHHGEKSSKSQSGKKAA